MYRRIFSTFSRREKEFIEWYTSGYSAKDIQDYKEKTHEETWEIIDKYYEAIESERDRRIVLLYLEHNEPITKLGKLFKLSPNTISYILQKYLVTPCEVKSTRTRLEHQRHNYLPKSLLDRKVIFLYKKKYDLKYIAHVVKYDLNQVQEVLDTWYSHAKLEHQPILHLYLDDKLNMRDIAKTIGKSPTLVNKILNYYDVGYKDDISGNKLKDYLFSSYS